MTAYRPWLSHRWAVTGSRTRDRRGDAARGWPARQTWAAGNAPVVPEWKRPGIRVIRSIGPDPSRFPTRGF